MLPQVVREHDRAASQSEEHRRDRFSHLLKPIRDLAENFSIDLATELEDYLEELEGITIAFHDEASDDSRTLNFAEAALLIRGSSLIYSKKVDYLYELVFKVLDTVCAQKDKRIRVDLHNDNGDVPGEDGEDGLGGGDRSGTSIDLVSSFLSLDDVIVDPKATMDRSSSSSLSSSSDYYAGMDGAPHTLNVPEWDVDKRRAEAIQFAPPLAFLHAVEAQANSGADASSSFQLSISQVHASGALLINPNAETNYNVLSDHTTALCAAGDTYTSALRDVLHVHTAAEAFGGGADGAHFDQDAGGDDFYDGEDGGFDDFGDMGGMGGGLDFQAGYGGGSSVVGASFGVDKPVSKQLFGESRSMLVGQEEEEEEEIDYWSLHNAHDDSSANKRPFRMGKTFSVPDLSIAHVLPQGPVIASLLVNDTVASSSTSSSVASREFGYILLVAKKIKKELAKRRKQMSAAKKAAAMAATSIDVAGGAGGYEEDEAGAAAQAAAATYVDLDVSVAGAFASADQPQGMAQEDGGEDGQFDYGEDGGFGGTFDDDYGDAFGGSVDGPEDASADGGAFTTFGGSFQHQQYSEDMDEEGADMYNTSYAQLCRSHGESVYMCALRCWRSLCILCADSFIVYPKKISPLFPPPPPNTHAPIAHSCRLHAGNTSLCARDKLDAPGYSVGGQTSARVTRPAFQTAV